MWYWFVVKRCYMMKLSYGLLLSYCGPLPEAPHHGKPLWAEVGKSHLPVSGKKEGVNILAVAGSRYSDTGSAPYLVFPSHEDSDLIVLRSLLKLSP